MLTTKSEICPHCQSRKIQKIKKTGWFSWLQSGEKYICFDCDHAFLVKLEQPEVSVSHSQNGQKKHDLNGVDFNFVDFSSLAKSHSSVNGNGKAHATRQANGTSQNTPKFELALNTYHRIINLMNGEMWVKNEQGNDEQLSFCVKLEIGDSEDENPSEMIWDTPEQNIHILLVESKNYGQPKMNLFLQKQGFIVDAVSSGKEILKAIKGKKYHAIMIDISASASYAMKVLIAIRNTSTPNKQVPVIGLSNDENSKYLNKFKKTGMSDFLVTPINKKQTLNKVNYWISHPVSPAPHAFG